MRNLTVLLLPIIMAVNDALLSRLGQVQGTGAVDTLFKTLGQAELLNALDRSCVFKDKIKYRMIRGGRSAEFNISGRLSAAYVTPGIPLLGTTNNPSDINIKTIYLDGLMAADVAIFDMDDLMNYVSTRQEYMKQIGLALAWETDKRIARIIFAGSNPGAEPLARTINAGRQGFRATLSGGYTASSKTAKGDELVQAIGAVVTAMRKKDVNTADICCVVAPDEYDFLNESSKAINSDYNGGGPALSNGTIANGQTLKIKGIPIYYSNHVTQSAYTNGPFDKNTDYAQDLTKCRALLFAPEAVGMLALRAPKLQMTAADGDFNVQYQSQLLVATQSIGIGRLRDECAAAILIP